MIRAILFTTALALTAPAMAQQTMGADPAMSPATPQTAQPAAPAQPQSATPAQPAPAASVASIVDSEFPAYDANSDRQLDQSEFSRWMLALKHQEMKATGRPLAADQITAWANGAFKTADTDKNGMISKPELIAYLSGGGA